MTEKIKVLSYNIHKGNGFFTRLKVLPQIKNLINNIDADILSWVHDEIVDRIAEDIVDTVSESKHKIMVEVANKYLHNVEIDCEMTILPHWTK